MQVSSPADVRLTDSSGELIGLDGLEANKPLHFGLPKVKLRDTLLPDENPKLSAHIATAKAQEIFALRL